MHCYHLQSVSRMYKTYWLSFVVLSAIVPGGFSMTPVAGKCRTFNMTATPVDMTGVSTKLRTVHCNRGLMVPEYTHLIVSQENTIKLLLSYTHKAYLPVVEFKIRLKLISPSLPLTADTFLPQLPIVSKHM